MEERVRLIIMQLKKNPKNEKSTFLATIANLKENIGAKGYLPSCMKKVKEKNKVVMPKEPPRCLPPMMEVDHKNKLDIGRQLRGCTRASIESTDYWLRMQDSDAYAAAKRRDHHINRWGSMLRPANTQ